MLRCVKSDVYLTLIIFLICNYLLRLFRLYERINQRMSRKTYNILLVGRNICLFCLNVRNKLCLRQHVIIMDIFVCNIVQFGQYLSFTAVFQSITCNMLTVKMDLFLQKL